MTNPRAFVDIDALEHQAEYHKTADDSIRDQGTIKNGRVVRVLHKVQRRVTELRIWRDLDDAQKGAAERIYRGWFITTQPVQAKTMNLGDRVDGSRADPDWLMKQRDDYRAWTTECHRQNKSPYINLCLSVFCYGNPIDEAAKLARMRRANVVPALKVALDIFNDVNGARG